MNMENDINWIRTDRDALREQLNQAQDQLRAALYNVEYLTKLALGAQAESVKHLMRCPKCGSMDIRLATDNQNQVSWYCFSWGCQANGQRDVPSRDNPLAALLAWHGLEE